MKANVKVFSARKQMSKSGKEYFQQLIELSQDDAPTVSETRTVFSQDKVLDAGQYTVDVKVYSRQLTDSKGYKNPVNIVRFSNFVKA